MMAEYEGDNNHDHFQRTPEFAEEVKALPDEIRQEFLDFLISSITSEFSGCVLYNEIQKNVENPDIKQLMRFMARDESRHAGFINQSLKDFDLGSRPRQPEAHQGLHATSSRSTSSTRPTCRRRSATRATSPSSASSSAIPRSASIRSFAGSSAGATTSSGTASRSR